MKPEEAKNKQLEQVLNDNELEEATGGVDFTTTSWPTTNQNPPQDEPLFTLRKH